MIHYSADGVESPGSDDNYVMMPDAGMDILAPANAYGTNSAIVSGQGVPQWYGSAESSGYPRNYIYNRDNELEEKIREFNRDIANRQEDIEGIRDRSRSESPKDILISRQETNQAWDDIKPMGEKNRTFRGRKRRT